MEKRFKKNTEFVQDINHSAYHLGYVFRKCWTDFYASTLYNMMQSPVGYRILMYCRKRKLEQMKLQKAIDSLFGE